MRINAIVATDQKGIIGKAGDIPWYLPADLKYFKRTTMGYPVIMGRKTYESIGRPLPKRTNLVLTRDPFYMSTGVVVLHSLQEALEHPACLESEEVFIIGGGELYRQSLGVTERVFLTRVATEIEGGDAFFPELDLAEWELIHEQEHKADERNELDYVFQTWERK